MECLFAIKARILRAALLLGLAVCTGGRARAETVDRIVAAVGDRVVTESDLALSEVLLQHLGCVETVLCDPEEPLLDKLVDEAVIRGLAGDVATFRPPPDEVERRVASFRASWQDPEGYTTFLKHFGLSGDDLAGLIFSHMVVERYVRRTVGVEVATQPGLAPQDPSVRYREWIGRQRSLVSIRLVPPLSETPQ